MAARTVLLCSYGPKKATHAAVRRLRSMLDRDDQLIVYAGTRSGFADAGKTSRVDVVDALGREGLLEALAQTNGDHVLHVTDGVEVTAATLGRLFAATERTGKLVTPWTNDIGTDHYVGPLPTDGNTTAVLNAIAKQQPEAVVRVLRPVCVGGTPAQLTGLVPFHLSYPTTVFRLLHEDCIVVEGTVAAHNGSAQDRLSAPVGADGRPLLIASMIVRDEEELLPGCLESLTGLVDRIDVCDTGSVDRTIEIAREFGCNVIERPWRDDFAWARNEVLEIGRDAWYSLWIDADERVKVDDVVRVRRELATGVDHFEAYALALRSDNSASESGPTSGGSNWTTPRILRTDSMHYVGALHEQIMRRRTNEAGVSVTLEGLEILHLGYTPELIKSRDKVTRNLNIARAAFEADPTDGTAALHYARSMWLAGTAPEERIPVLETAQEGLRHGDAPTRAFVVGLLARTVAVTADKERGLELALEALALVPADDTAFEALIICAKSLDKSEQILERQDAYTHGPSLNPKIADPALRATNRAEIVRLLRDAGRVDEALRHTSELLAESQQDFPHWELLIDSLLDTRTAEEFVVDVGHLLTSTSDGGWARPLATRVRRDIALGLIEAHLDSGGRDPEPVRVGLTLAMVMDDEAALSRLISRHRDLLPEEDRRAMAERLRERGLAVIAGELAPAAPPSTFLL